MGFKTFAIYSIPQWSMIKGGRERDREEEMKEMEIQLASMKTVWSATWISALKRFFFICNRNNFPFIDILLFTCFLLNGIFGVEMKKKKQQHKTPWMHRKNSMAMMRMHFNCICIFRRQEAQFLLSSHLTTQRPHKVWIH